MSYQVVGGELGGGISRPFDAGRIIVSDLFDGVINRGCEGVAVVERNVSFTDAALGIAESRRLPLCAAR